MGKKYGGNTVFYKNALQDKLGLKDVFSDVFKKHAKGDGERVFLAGTSATTPGPNEMLRTWKKPWVFARVFAGGFVFLALLYIMIRQGYGMFAITPFVFFGAALVPLTVLLFFWEMNVPRNIPIYEVLMMFLIGGVISLLFTGWLNSIMGDNKPAYLALLTEEPAKLLALCLFLRKEKRGYILNGILIGAAIGAGFGAIESAGYYLMSSTSGSLFDLSSLHNLILRALLAPGMHVAWAAIYGGALAMVKGNGKLRLSNFYSPGFLKYFSIACAMHFCWNADFLWFGYIQLPFLGISFTFTHLLLIVAAWALLLHLLLKGLNQVLRVTELTQMPAAQLAGRTQTLALRGCGGVYQGQTIPLSGCITIGRDPSKCNLVLPAQNREISRVHCSVEQDGNAVILQDESSQSGVYLADGSRIAPGQSVRLFENQIFYLGTKNVMFQVVRAAS